MVNEQPRNRYPDFTTERAEPDGAVFPRVLVPSGFRRCRREARRFRRTESCATVSATPSDGASVPFPNEEA